MRGLLVAVGLFALAGCGGGGPGGFAFSILNQSGDCLFRVEVYAVPAPPPFDDGEFLQGTDPPRTPSLVFDFNPPLGPGDFWAGGLAVPEGHYEILVLADCASNPDEAEVIALGDSDFPINLRPGTSCEATIFDNGWEVTCEFPN